MAESEEFSKEDIDKVVSELMDKLMPGPENGRYERMTLQNTKT